MKHVYSLQQLFEDRLFVVPEYQRGYAWEERQIDELLEDLETLPAGSDHYTGTVVLYLQDAEPVTDRSGTTYKRFDIVDGQQRLTTLTILVDRLSAELQTLEGMDELSRGLRQRYVATTDLM